MILSQKRAELKELLSLVSMHKCGHEHGDQPCPAASHGDEDDDLHRGDAEEERSSSSSSSSSSSGDEGAFEEALDGQSVMGVSQQAAAASTAAPVRFTL
jgi:hypothetical protein